MSTPSDAWSRLTARARPAWGEPPPPLPDLAARVRVAALALPAEDDDDGAAVWGWSALAAGLLACAALAWLVGSGPARHDPSLVAVAEGLP